VRRGDIALARQHWQALLAQMEPGSDMALRVQDDLLKLEALQAGPDK
jgi:cytochrome c-type biogenesis protein CcmH